jgi:hypothetical protein
MSRNCPECKRILQGRSIKKFCNDLCRNRYNYRKKSAQEVSVIQINNALKNNRQIFEKLFKGGRKAKKIKKERLQKLGFSFDVCTGVTTTESYIIYTCYGYYYFSPDDKRYTVGRTQKTISK